MRVQSGEAKIRMRTQDLGGDFLVARVDSELTFVAAGADKRVPAGFDSDVETKDDVDSRSVVADCGEPAELFYAVGDDVAQASRTAPPAARPRVLPAP